MEWTDCRKEVHDTSLKSLTIGVCAPGLSQPCNRTERWSEGAAQTHGHEWTSTVGLKSVEIRPWASVRQASLSLLSETGAYADLADRIERCLIPRIVRRSSPPSCSCSGCHATSLYSQRWVRATLGQRMPLYNDCMHCMLPTSRADSQAPQSYSSSPGATRGQLLSPSEAELPLQTQRVTPGRF